MAISFKNDMGVITISNNIIEDEVSRYCQEVGFYDKVWLAQKPDIRSELVKNSEIHIRVSIYVKFGLSMHTMSELIARQLRDFIVSKTKPMNAVITINISGVKSHNLVKRNMDIVFRFDSQGELVEVSDYE